MYVCGYIFQRHFHDFLASSSVESTKGLNQPSKDVHNKDRNQLWSPVMQVNKTRSINSTKMCIFKVPEILSYINNITLALSQTICNENSSSKNNCVLLLIFCITLPAVNLLQRVLGCQLVRDQQIHCLKSHTSGHNVQPSR